MFRGTAVHSVQVAACGVFASIFNFIITLRHAFVFATGLDSGLVKQILSFLQYSSWVQLRLLTDRVSFFHFSIASRIA